MINQNKKVVVINGHRLHYVFCFYDVRTSLQQKQPILILTAESNIRSNQTSAIRKSKVRTAMSRPCPAGQIDNGHMFREFRTENIGKKIRTGTEQKIPEYPDINETGSGHGQYGSPILRL